MSQVNSIDITGGMGDVMWTLEVPSTDSSGFHTTCMAWYFAPCGTYLHTSYLRVHVQVC